MRIDTTVDTELANVLAPDADRVIAAPIRTPEDDAYIARVRRGSLAIALACIAGIVLLLKLFGARSFN